MVTSVYSLPNTKFRSHQWGFMSNDGQFYSEFSGQMQTVEYGGGFWQASFTLSGMKGDGADGLAWKAFFAALRGRNGRFYAYDLDKRTISYTGASIGTPLVNGANQIGNMLVTDGWTNSIVIKAGSYIEFNSEYKMITEDVTVDGSGNATLPIFPAMRASPPDNEPIVTTNPKCLMMLDNTNQQWQSDAAKVVDITFTAREAFDFTTFLLTEAGDNLITEAGDYLVT